MMCVSHTAIGVAGTGRLARALGRALIGRAMPVTVVAGRDPHRAADAAAFMGAGVRAVPLSEFPGRVSRVVLATTDDHMMAVAGQLAAAGFRDGLALHTCGARGPELLAPLAAAGIHCGVFHPLQTIVYGTSSFEGVTFGLAGDDAAVAWGEEMVRALDAVAIRLDPARIGAYHAAAVLAANGITALLDASLSLMAYAGLDGATARRALAPLAMTAVENSSRLGPVTAATGPVVRGDAATIVTHLQAIAAGCPSVMPLYLAISNHLLDLARQRGLPADRQEAIERALRTDRGAGEEYVADQDSHP